MRFELLCKIHYRILTKAIAKELVQNLLFAQNKGARGQKKICDINWRIRRFMTKDENITN